MLSQIEKNTVLRNYRKYPIQFEIFSGKAFFSNPWSNPCPRSHIIPSPEQLRNMMNGIAAIRTAFFVPIKIEICSDIDWMPYTFNSAHSPFIGRIKQVKTMILHNVRYKVYATTYQSGADDPKGRDINPLHSLQEIFMRRLKKGQSYHNDIFMGTKEFLVEYIGPFTNAEANEDINTHIPSFPMVTYDRYEIGNSSERDFVSRSYDIIKGECHYVEGVLSHV